MPAGQLRTAPDSSDGAVSACRTGRCRRITTRGQHARAAAPRWAGLYTDGRGFKAPRRDPAPSLAPPRTLEPAQDGGCGPRPPDRPLRCARTLPRPLLRRARLSPSSRSSLCPSLTASVFHVSPCRGVGCPISSLSGSGCPRVPPCPRRAVLGSAPHTCGGCAPLVLTCLYPQVCCLCAAASQRGTGPAGRPPAPCSPRASRSPRAAPSATTRSRWS